MLFNWDITSEHKINLSAQELYEELMARLTDSASKFEVRNAEYEADTFKIVAALKSKSAYVMSYKGKYTNYASPYVTISYNSGTVATTVKIAGILEVLYGVAMLFDMFIMFMLVFIAINESVLIGILMLLLISPIVALLGLVPQFYAKRCNKAAAQCILEAIHTVEVSGA